MSASRLRFHKRKAHGESEPGDSQTIRHHETLLQQAQSGNEEALNELCQFVFEAAGKYLRAADLPRSYYAPDDFEQEVVIDLVEQLGGIRRLRAWLPAVLFRKRAYFFRHHHERLMSRLEEVESQITAGGQQRGAEQESRLISSLDFDLLVNRLPDLQRNIVVLHFIDGMRFKDIAKLLGMQPGSVRMHFWRAKQRLEKYLNLDRGEKSSHGTDA